MPELGPVDPSTRGQLVGDLDGGVSGRVVRRCRTAASILLAIGALLLLVVALTPWNVVTALLALAAGTQLLCSVLLFRRSALWSAAARSQVPDIGRTTDAPELAQFRAVTSDQSVPLPATATIGPTRMMSPGLAGAPVRRRLKSSVVPIYASAARSPGGGALVVHARSDEVALLDGDSVRVWRIGRTGLASLGDPTAGGRFVLYRGSDNMAFLGTTRLTDIW